MIVCVELVLQIGKLRDALFQQALGFFFRVNTSGVIRIMILKAKVFSIVYKKRLYKFARLKFQGFPRIIRLNGE